MGDTYAYDALNRLTSVRGNLSQDYTYDRLGNFDTVTKWGVTWDYSYQKDDNLTHKPLRLTTVSGLNFSAAPTTGYDGRGNLTQYTQGNVSSALAYDVEGRLTSVTTQQGTQAAKTTTFTYDADGNRVRVLYPDGGGDIYTPFPDVEKAIAGGVTTWRITFSAAGQMVAQRVTAGATVTLYSLHTDRLGSVVAVGNGGGGLVSGSYAAYEPFGTFLVQPTGTNPSVTDRGFTGQRSNNLSPAWLGLVYMNARYYQPQLGRFVSPDSIVPEPENPQSYNRYAYSYNNPVNYIDPSGHDPLDADWEEAFKQVHGRTPDLYDRLIRLFSIAFPEEWDWGAFYDNNGYLRSFEIFRDIMTHPPSSRSWAAMPDALTRLSAYYAWNESEMFARDIGTLFGGLPDRASHSMNFAVTGCERVPAPICDSPTILPAQDWAYLQPAGMPSYLRGDDADSNVHHWAWGVALGAYMGNLAVVANTARETIGVGGINNLMNDPNALADVYFGNRGAYFGSALRTFGPRATSLLYSFYVAEWR